jgi:hypothetical protein
MNKKILFFILLTIVAFPVMTHAINSPTVMADKIKDLAITIGTAVVVIGWVISGILYLTSLGDPSKTTLARKALIAALIGTALVVIANLGYDGIKTFLNPILGG